MFVLLPFVFLLTCTVHVSLVIHRCKSFAVIEVCFTFMTLFVDVFTRFTSVRVSAKYHGIKLEYREHRHSVLDLLGQIRTKLRVWKRPYISPEAVRVLLQEWHVSSLCSDFASSIKFIYWEWFEGSGVQGCFTQS